MSLNDLYFVLLWLFFLVRKCSTCLPFRRKLGTVTGQVSLNAGSTQTSVQFKLVILKRSKGLGSNIEIAMETNYSENWSELF